MTCEEVRTYRTEDGYGRQRRGGLRKMAHVWAWIDAHGPVPKGMHVLHHCDNPACINVAHLFLGTIADNNRDRHEKGRTVLPDQRGENHSRARLTEDDVRTIREMAHRGSSCSVIAPMFGVDRTQVSHIVSRRGWAHVV